MAEGEVKGRFGGAPQLLGQGTHTGEHELPGSEERARPALPLQFRAQAGQGLLSLGQPLDLPLGRLTELTLSIGKIQFPLNTGGDIQRFRTVRTNVESATYEIDPGQLLPFLGNGSAPSDGLQAGRPQARQPQTGLPQAGQPQAGQSREDLKIHRCVHVEGHRWELGLSDAMGPLALQADILAEGRGLWIRPDHVRSPVARGVHFAGVHSAGVHSSGAPSSGTPANRTVPNRSDSAHNGSTGSGATPWERMGQVAKCLGWTWRGSKGVWEHGNVLAPLWKEALVCRGWRLPRTQGVGLRLDVQPTPSGPLVRVQLGRFHPSDDLAEFDILEAARQTQSVCALALGGEGQRALHEASEVFAPPSRSRASTLAPSADPRWARLAASLLVDPSHRFHPLWKQLEPRLRQDPHARALTECVRTHQAHHRAVQGAPDASVEFATRALRYARVETVTELASWALQQAAQVTRSDDPARARYLLQRASVVRNHVDPQHLTMLEEAIAQRSASHIRQVAERQLQESDDPATRTAVAWRASRALQDLGDFEAAERMLMTVLDWNADDPEVLQELAELDARRDLTVRAVSRFDRVADLWWSVGDPTASARCLHRAATLLESMGRGGAARHRKNVALERDPTYRSSPTCAGGSPPLAQRPPQDRPHHRVRALLTPHHPGSPHSASSRSGSRDSGPHRQKGR